MWAAIGGIVQIIFLILQTKFEKDAAERKSKDEALSGWDDAVKSGDPARINAMLLKFRLRS